MTYCVGLLLNDGLVMLADSRTNAGVDYISTYSKLTVWEQPGERMISLMTAGNLSLSQSIVTMLNEGLPNGDGESVTMSSVHSMTEAARLVGRAIREVRRLDAPALKESGIDFEVSFVLGGQIADRHLRLFLFYSAGNFIEAGPDSPYFQIGELKYGKPILDRVVTVETSLNEAAKCAMISMDSTIRSNISVGPPLDLLIYRRDSLKVDARMTLAADDPYYKMISEGWSGGLREAFDKVPDPDWV